MAFSVKPRILYSECLGIRPVRHDGNIIFDAFAEELKKHVEVIPVCPEVSIGLGVPRNPVVLYEDGGVVELVETVTGERLASRMREFSTRFLEKLVVDGALLKAGSPSCGVGDAKVYGAGRRVLRKSDGLFTSILRTSYRWIPVESEKRLLSHGVRRLFLTRIYALADLRATIDGLRGVEDLVDFHRRYKYLVMLHSPSILKKLGRLVAGRSLSDPGELAAAYRSLFIEALRREPSRRSYVNVFTHIYGHVKRELNPEERRFVLTLIEKYRDGGESLNTLLAYFRGFIYRFGNKYLAEQRFIKPYPEELDHAPPGSSLE